MAIGVVQNRRLPVLGGLHLEQSDGVRYGCSEEDLEYAFALTLSAYGGMPQGKLLVLEFEPRACVLQVPHRSLSTEHLAE